MIPTPIPPAATSETLTPETLLQHRLSWPARLSITPVGALGVVIVATLAVIAVTVPLLPVKSPTALAGAVYSPVSSMSWAGTDHLGRDIFSRLLWGSRVSLLVAVGVVVLGLLPAAVWGLASGTLGGRFDTFSQRFVDALMVLPGLLLALALIAVLGPSVVNVTIALSLGSLPATTRTCRAAALGIRAQPYCDAAFATGCTTARVMFRHVLPNITSVVLVLAPVTMSGAILGEASLSFLGLGVPPGTPSWGGDLSRGAIAIYSGAHWAALFPALILSVAVLGLNLTGDWLRDVFDPKTRGG